MTQPAGDVLILTGPPGSGKTSAAAALTRMREHAVHLESDVFWGFITSGYVEPWKPESHEQNTVVMEIVADAATRYARAGYFTVIDGIVSPRWFYEPLRSALTGAGLGVSYAILRPPLPVAAERAASSVADRRVIEQLWNEFADLGDELEAHVIDNGELTAEETALAIEARLKDGSLSA